MDARMAGYARLGATDGLLDDVPGCPGLALDLGALWAEVDRFLAESPPEEGGEAES